MKKILIVDDELEIREMLKTYLKLKMPEIVIEESEDGEDAFEKLSNKEFDLLITDLYMTKMGGIELIEKVRAFHTELPVIVVSAFFKEIRDMEKIKANAFIRKPLRLEQLLKHVRELM